MRVLILAVIIGSSGAVRVAAETEVVTLPSLLAEQADLAALARFPEPVYRQLQASSYNRLSTARNQTEQGLGGWFADSDGIGFIREESHDGRREWVLMEHEGPGCLTKFWTPYFYRDFNNRVGPRIRVYIDGAEEPEIDATFIELMTRNEWPESYGERPVPSNDFAAPWPYAGFTARAGNFYLPIPFARKCKVTLSEQPFYHIINYRAYEPGTAVRSFSQADWRNLRGAVDAKAERLLHPQDERDTSAHNMDFVLPPGDTQELELPAGNHCIRSLEFSLDPRAIAAQPQLLRSVVLALKFDGEETVWTPLGDFFCSANAINPLDTWTRTVTADGRIVCRWVMPYAKSASVSLRNLSKVPISGAMTAKTGDWNWDARSMHFNARWRPDHVQRGDEFVDWNFVDVRGQGVFVGDTWTVLNLTSGWWGEGDEKIYVDDAYDVQRFPDHFGTGTEDYYGWAGGVNPTRDDIFQHPFLANASVGSTDESSTRGFNVCSRIRSLDAIPFHNRLVFDMEASPGTEQRNRWDLLGYSVVTMFYAYPGATTNRPAEPAAAALPIMSLDKLTRRSQQLRTTKQHRIEGAIEGESLRAVTTAGDVTAAKQLPASSFRPDEVLSDGQHLFIPFAAPGDTVQIKLTEQFQPKRVMLHMTKCYDFGVVDIAVNGRTLSDGIDLYSDTLAVQPVDLGVCQPQGNAFVIELKLRRSNGRSRGAQTLAGLDCIVLEELAGK